MSYQQRRRPSTLIDGRFDGRSVELHIVNGEKLLGLVDEVALNEVGLIVEGTPIIIPRSAILYVATGLSDIHGHGECCEYEYILDENFIGSDVLIKLANGTEVSGRILKLAKNEIGVVQGNRALIIPRSSILYIRILRR